MSFLDYLRLLVNVFGLATGIALVFIALIPQRRTASNFNFAIFATVLAAYSFTLILRSFPNILPLSSPIFTLSILAVYLVFFIISFFFFLVNFLSLWEKTIPRYGVYTSIVLAILAFIALFRQEIFSEISPDGKMFSLSIWAYLLLAGAVMYSLFATWYVWTSKDEQAAWLRLPTVFISIGYFTTILAPDYPLDTFFFTVAAFWTAYALLRQQIFSPIQSLNRELYEANKELQETIGQLGREKLRVEQLNAELIDSNRYKGEFLANMSHELRTPLNSIIGYSELLNSPIYGELNKQQKDRLERIYRNGLHLANLIDSILDLSKIESDKFQLEAQDFHIVPCIEAAIAQVKDDADAKSLEITSSIPSDLPKLKGDAKRIEQVLFNLLDNAVKFTNEGTISLEALQLRVKSGISDDYQLPMQGWLKDGAWLLIRVSDTGIGIAQEDLSRIFLNFAQLDGSRTREYGGIGLGLTIAKRLVELHFGIIWVQSKLGEGSSFYVALPVLQ